MFCSLRSKLSFYHNIKDNERNLCQDLLTIENADSDLKVRALHYANELLAKYELQQLQQNMAASEEPNPGAQALRVRLSIRFAFLFAFRLLFFFFFLKTFAKSVNTQKQYAKSVNMKQYENNVAKE